MNNNCPCGAYVRGFGTPTCRDTPNVSRAAEESSLARDWTMTAFHSCFAKCLDASFHPTPPPLFLLFVWLATCLVHASTSRLEGAIKVINLSALREFQ